MVVPVDAGGAGAREGEHLDPDTGGVNGTEEVEERSSVFESQDPDSVVPILKYSREPNKYGRTTVLSVLVSHLSRHPLVCPPGVGLARSDVFRDINVRSWRHTGENGTL